MKKFALLFLLLVLKSLALAQSNIAVTGKVLENKNTPVPGAGVFLFNNKDTLKTVTDTAGNFYFKTVTTAVFSIKVRSLGYITQQQNFSLRAASNIKLDPIILNEETLQLKNVDIKGKVIPIRIKEDTLEYDARAFQVQEKDRLTEMLKLMPGLQVDHDGNVTSMGQTLTRIRVNGKDFFTGNVKEFVSKLPASIVSKVQVVEDYGDEANFTGMKTGTPKKILNIVTNGNIDSGKFGSLYAESASNDRLGLWGDGSYWKGDKQISASARLSTQNNGVGKANSAVAKTSFNNRINKTTTLKTSYDYDGSATNSRTLSDINTVINQEVLINKDSAENYNNLQKHALSGTLERKTNSELIRFVMLANLSQESVNGFRQSLQSGLNRQDQHNQNVTDGSQPSLSLKLNHSIKLAKPGRLFQYELESLWGNNALTESRTDQTTYYDIETGLKEKDSILNRRIEEGKRNGLLSGKLTFSEPLKSNNILKSKKNVSVSYAFSQTKNKNHLSTFADRQGQFALVDSLSNAFVTSFTQQELRLSYLFSRKGLRYSFGMKSALSTLKGEYQNNTSGVNLSLFNLSPVFNVLVLRGKSSISLNLNQTITPPTFSQLQPIPEARNLQRIVIGNPELKPEISQNLSLNFNKTTLRGISLQSNLTTSIIQNRVATNTLIVKDTLNSLRQEIRYLNANGDLNFTGMFMAFKTIKKIIFSMSGQLDYANNLYFSENVKGFNRTISFSQGLGSQVNLKNFMLQSIMGYRLIKNTYSTGNINPSSIQTWSLNATGRIVLTESINTTFSFDKTINTGYNFENPSPFVVGLGVDKSFFKKTLILGLSVDDLFNQRNNQQRNIAGNVTSDIRTNQVKRVFLLGLRYRLDKFGSSYEQNPGVIIDLPQ